jgi:hypothetical protein
MRFGGEIAVLYVLIACSGGCSSAAGSGSTSGGSATAATSARPVIGALATRDRKVVLLSAPEGLRVTVEDASGAVIAKEIPIEDLRDQDALLYELCRSAVAANGAFVDARIDPLSGL